MLDQNGHRLFPKLVLQRFFAIFYFDDHFVLFLELHRHLPVLIANLFVFLKHELRQVYKLL
jgi:hypothetical protein